VRTRRSAGSPRPIHPRRERYEFLVAANRVQENAFESLSLIFRSKDGDEATGRLREPYSLSPEQADLILMRPHGSVPPQDRVQIREELDVLTSGCAPGMGRGRPGRRRRGRELWQGRAKCRDRAWSGACVTDRRRPTVPGSVRSSPAVTNSSTAPACDTGSGGRCGQLSIAGRRIAHRKYIAVSCDVQLWKKIRRCRARPRTSPQRSECGV